MMSERTRALCLAAGVLLAACQPQMPSPRIDGVQPDRGWSGEDTLVTIHGADFYPQVELSAGRGGADLDRTFEAWLESPGGGARFALSGVNVESYTRLRGVVPQGLPAGGYDLLLRGPTGREGRLASAFTVADTRADRVVLASSQLAWQVHEFAQVDLYLVDPHGERVFTDLPLELTVTRELDAPVEVSFGSGILHDQEVLPSGRVVGSTGADGFARVLFTVPEPDTYTLTATPTDPTLRLDPVQLKLLFEPGAELSLSIRLPEPDFEARAGEPFEVQLELQDQFGNPVPDVATTVPLRNRCGTWLDLVLVRGPTTLPVTLTTASQARCPEDGLWTDEISAVQGASEGFIVHPGDPAGFAVELGPGPLWAGRSFLARVDPLDAWGNRTAWSGELVMAADPGGPVAGECGITGVSYMCTGIFTQAAPEVRLEVHSEGGALTGISAPVEVRPSTELYAVEVQTPDPVVAGERATVEVIPYDEFGNVMDAAALGASGWALADELGEADCLFEGPTPSGSAAFGCTLFTARQSASVELEAGGQMWSSEPFEITNGPLAQVWLDLPAQVEAGVAFSVEIWAADAFGNPYLTQHDPILWLTEEREQLDPVEITLGADATANLSLILTAAGSTRLQIRQGGALLGSSAPFTVQPGPTDHLKVSIEGPWAWVGEETPVWVEAVDLWGNRTDLDAPVSLISLTTGEEANPELIEGRADGLWTYTDGALDEVLLASAAGFDGESAPFHVVASCPGAGPVAALSFAGEPFARACIDPLTGTGTVAGSFADALAGEEPLFAWALAVEEGPAVHSSLPSALLELPGAGAYPLRGLVIDEAFCADEAFATAWVGRNNGQPVGPLVLIPDEDLLNARADTTSVSVLDVRDCAGDLAVGGQIRIRSTLGGLTGLDPTGEGLALELDGAGSGVFGFSALPVDSPGLATLHAWVPEGAAGGQAHIEIIQDHQPPVVLEQLPAGRWLEPVQTLRLVLSEPVRANTVIPGNFSITGPGATQITGVALEADGTEIVLTLDPPAQGADGAWVLTAANIRDIAGNRLDGEHSGSPSPWVGHFGDVPAGPLQLSCGLLSPPEGSFRPDGDPGPGPQADEVQIAASRTGFASWWVLTVEGAGQRWLREHLPIGSADGVLRWDGRDQRGIIVENGEYTVGIEIVDGYGNRSDPCAVEVRVENSMGGGW